MSDNFFPRNPLPKNPRPDEVRAVIGLMEEPGKDWRTLFHDFDATVNTPDPVFLIRDFMQEGGITGIVGPPRERKTIAALNVAHSLLTGEPLFGKFAVVKKPERVVYLTPESGLASFTKRLRRLGLARYVGKSLFYRTMNSDPLALDDPALRPAFEGAVVFLDTMVRFFDGDENNSQDMRRFGDICHSLIRDSGAIAVVLLHHAGKINGRDKGTSITLERMGRGSGDFGAFLACCWGVVLQGDDYYKSPSLVTCLKQRDFPATDFEVLPSGDPDDYFLRYVEGSENAKVRVGAKEKADKAKALAFVRSHLDLSPADLSRQLAAMGIVYNESSCTKFKREAAALTLKE